MAERITSKTNPALQQIRKLTASRKARYESRRFVADGVKLVEEALRWGAAVETLVLTDGVDFPAPEGIRVLRVSPELMKDVSRMETPQGVIAICRMPEPEPAALAPGFLILDGIQDHGNLGTILRTADAFSVPVVLADGCADPWSEKTVRASMGAVFRTAPIQMQTDRVIEACRAQKIPICVTALRPGASDLRKLELRRFAVVIGSEGQGVGEAFLQAAAQSAVIPMSPRCESLNAAVAAALVLWQLQRLDRP